jgi:dipeptidyl aminopeptidase/acylaminoacyl peptidase
MVSGHAQPAWNPNGFFRVITTMKRLTDGVSPSPANRHRLVFSILTRLGMPLFALFVSCTSTAPGTRTDVTPSEAASPSGPPEGALLVFSGKANGPVLLVHGVRDRVSLAPGFVGYDISPDGSQVVATREERLSTGISYNPELVLIDNKTQERTLLARTRPREEFNGPIKWSPAGTSLAYSLVRYAVNPAQVHPGPHTELQTICVRELETKTSTCFRQLRRVFDFDWSPDGKSLLVTGPGPFPMQVLDPATGDVSTFVTLDDRTLRRHLTRAGLGKAVQFISPSWSPSGAYVASWVNARLLVPAIFGRDGKLVALGHPARGNAYKLSWRPGRDVLVYTTGFSLEWPKPWVLRELNLSDREDRVLITRPNRPLTTDFSLSPSGRWLAVLRWKSDSHQEIEFLSVTEHKRPRRLDFSSLQTLADWGATQ